MYLLNFGQEGDRWQVSLKTESATYYFISLEALMLFLYEQMRPRLAEENTAVYPLLPVNHDNDETHPTG